MKRFWAMALIMGFLLMLRVTPLYARDPSGAPQSGAANPVQQNGKLNPPVSFSAAAPFFTRIIGKVPAAVVPVVVDHRFRAYYFLSAQNTLYAVDPATSKYVVIGKAVPEPGHRWRATAWDPNRRMLFAVSIDSDADRETPSSLYSINPDTGQVKRIGDISNGGQVVAIMVQPATGALYGINATSDSLILINTISGGSKEIGPLGFNVSGNAP